ncbi:major facilitator superfamily protein [Striga asiatica]|uniref:Major facilitator superfamily protein n=1 Tax=Striga asiatica TaxID=4170 RepID=A0A5A7RB68_STRAF|nr:major facilitator superfamily protein [Striga asiatica]
MAMNLYTLKNLKSHYNQTLLFTLLHSMPFSRALIATRIQQLDGYGLGHHPGPALIICKTFVDRPKTPLAKKIAGREFVGHELELEECEDVKTRRQLGIGQIARAKS